MFLLEATLITVNDLVSIILGIGGAVALIFLVILLIKLIKTISRVNSMLDDAKEPIDTVLTSAADSVPEILENVKNISGDASGIVSSASGLIENISLGRKKKKRQRAAESLTDIKSFNWSRLLGFIAGFVSALRKNKSKSKKDKK